MQLRVAMKNKVEHETLAILFNAALAGQLRHSLLKAGVDEEKVWSLVQTAVFDLTMMFDEGTLEVNNRTFRPRVSFVGEDGNALPGSAEFSHLHEYGAVTEEDIQDSRGFKLRF